MGGKGGEAGVKTPPGDKKPSVPVFGSGLAIGAFLAVSTNLRYQVGLLLIGRCCDARKKHIIHKLELGGPNASFHPTVVTCWASVVCI